MRIRAGGLTGDLRVAREAVSTILNRPALEHRPDPNEQVGQIDGLGHEIIGAGGHHLPKM